MQVVLRKLSFNANALRTPEVEGVAFELPEVGRSFRVIGKPVVADFDYREVTTSTVQEVNVIEEDRGGAPKTLIFRTLNSEYQLEIL